jgi:AbrB family looped-hinge helix DNA binding protein
MVNFVVKIKIDSQGRILIPAEFRRKLELETECEVGLTIIGNEIVIKKVNTDLKAKVKQWKQDLMKMSIPIGVTSDKWMDIEYAERKLGLL